MASRLVHGSASRSPSIGGTAAPLPVATTTALRATSVSSPTSTPALAVEPRAAAHERRSPWSSSHGSMSGVVEVVDDLVAPLEHRAHVEVAGHGLAHAGDAPHLGQQLARAQQRLRRHARVERALAADQLLLDERHLEARVAEPPGADLAGGAAAHHHHVELALRHGGDT